MSLISSILPVSNIVLDLPATSKKRAFEHAALLIENCRLEPAADAALHALLLPLLDNAAMLKEGRETQAALAGLDAALQQYRRSFVAPAKESGHAH